MKQKIKARRCKKDTYPTTIIPYNKIEKKKEKGKLIFVSSFTSRLFYIEYNQTVFGPFSKACFV